MSLTNECPSLIEKPIIEASVPKVTRIGILKTETVRNNKAHLMNDENNSSSAKEIRGTRGMQQTPSSLASGDGSKMQKSSDQQLVELAQKGDKRAFDMLVIKYQSKVASIVSRYVSDYQEVSDVTQEAFIKAYRALKSFRGDSAFYTWIYRIGINCAKNYLVAKGRRPPSVDVDISDAEAVSPDAGLKDIASPESELRRDQLERVLKEAIRALPEDLKAALTLREFDGLSYEEIAEVMECPVGTVRSRIFRAREAIDEKIAPLVDGAM